jgi:hypothetical protein
MIVLIILISLGAFFSFFSNCVYIIDYKEGIYDLRICYVRFEMSTYYTLSFSIYILII